jgi:hypothetical protein
MLFLFSTTNETNPIRLHMTYASFRNCVCFSDLYSESILQTCRPQMLLKLASMLLRFISDDEDVSVLFLCASIVHFVHQNGLNDVDLSEILMNSQSSDRECIVCFSDTQLCLCPFCGACTCSGCKIQIMAQSNKSCPKCRKAQMFKPFPHRKQDNTLLWTAMLFFSIFGRHIHDFEEAERLDLESLRESLNAFLQQHNPFRCRPVMCIARWDSVGVSAEGASGCASAQVGSDCASAQVGSDCTSAQVDSDCASAQVDSDRLSAMYD